MRAAEVHVRRRLRRGRAPAQGPRDPARAQGQVRRHRQDPHRALRRTEDRGEMRS